MGKGNKLTMIKICGIKDMNTAHIAIDAGANALGFVFAESSRRIFPEDAKKIIQTLPKNILRVGVFVNAPISLVNKIAEYCNLTALQFHGTENVNYCRQYKRKVIKAIKVSKDGQLFPDPASYRGIVKYFLTDTYKPGADGGTGKVFPWKNLETIKKYGLVILAGGLNSNNIFQALSVTNPWGVDVSSGVETRGCKDEKKIKKYMEEIQRWKNGQNITR
jgi:phosphoribosylanthranilate isomerase